MPGNKLVGVVCTVDILKSDTEVKLLIGCTDNEINKVSDFLNSNYMSAIVIERSEVE